MGKIKIEGCDRCKKGDIALDRDQYGWYEYCLQCGYIRDLVDIFRPVRQQAGSLKRLRREIRMSGKGN